MSGIIPIDGFGGGGSGGGIVYPDSAARPFSSNSARNTWANNNKQDLIKDTTVVNVGGSQWYLWTGESNPSSVQTSLWMDASQIVPGEKGEKGDVGPQGLTVTNAVIDGAGELIITLNDGSTINAGVAKGADGTNGTDGLSVTNAEIDPSGDLIITLSDGSTLNAGFVGGADPKEGFELNSGGKAIGLNNDGALTVRDSGGAEHNAVDNGADTIRIGSPSMELELRTNQERVTIQNGGSDNQLAYLTDIPSPSNPVAPARFAYHVREGEYFLTEEQIQQEILLSVQPLVTIGDEKVTNIIFPDQATFERHYHIPGVNDADAGVKPHIESFRFALWQHQFQTEPAKVILTSNGNWLPFVSSEILDEYNGIYIYRPSQGSETDLHTFAFMRPLNFNPDVGIDGWSFHSIHPEMWIPLNEAPPPSDPAVTLGTFMIDDDESSHLRTGAGINSTFDALTGEHTLTVDPTNIDLSDYSKLDEINTFTEQQIIAKGSGVVLSLRGTPTGTDQIKFWSSGAIELPSYSNFKDKELITKEYADEVAAFKGEGLAPQVQVSVTSTTQTQTEPVTSFVHGWANSSSVTITADDANLTASESIVHLPEDAGPGGVTYTVVFGANSLAKQVRRGETWTCKANAVGIEWARVDKGLEVVRGMGDRGVDIFQPSLRLFQFMQGMPYHLLIETPGLIDDTQRSRLVHNFPKEKTFVFSPNALDRTYNDSIVINETNQGVATSDLNLGEYSDFPLYVMEPNVVINRDQRASINYPANMTIDVSNGFYVFGTMSGWCGNNRTSGTANVYVGSNDNTRSPFGAIGLRIADDGLYILDGTTVATQAQGSWEQIKFQRDDGLTNFYRFAFYVNDAGMMTYYVVSLNSGNVASGTKQCTLSNIAANPKVYHTYDRLGNNTAAIAIAETHLVLNTSASTAEGRWNWRF